ncbi:cupin domain-containing protein [Albidovulum marisflavi]|uniref:cupin domain-containing protein n=1 Tax=Albidovulum marisflavi TaxID=2984159 RepID=UPI0039951CFD
MMWTPTKAGPETSTLQPRTTFPMRESPDQHEAPAIARAEPATHYTWGDGCDGWRLVESTKLRVREERIPPGGAEPPHLHRIGRQTCYDLSGTLTVHLPGETCRLRNGDLLYVPAGVAHEVRNDADVPVRFLVTTTPAIAGDREETGCQRAPSSSGKPGSPRR